jgi:hypothetical protein
MGEIRVNIKENSEKSSLQRTLIHKVSAFTARESKDLILSRNGTSSVTGSSLTKASQKAIIKAMIKLTKKEHRYLNNTVLINKSIRLVKAAIATVMCASVIYAPLVSATQRVIVNEAHIQVDDQSQRTQQSALKQALRQVIVKLSGSAEVLTNPGVRAALSSPQSYLRSYRFNFEDGKTFYIADFDQAKLSSLLQREMLPLWGAVRPETLVWIAEEQGNASRTILDETSPSVLKDTLQATAKERGVPLSLPLMDLTDSVNITSFDVWGRFVEPLKLASSRYATDNIIGARIYKNDASAIPELPENPVPSGTIETLEDAMGNQETGIADTNITDIAADKNQEGALSAFSDNGNGEKENNAETDVTSTDAMGETSVIDETNDTGYSIIAETATAPFTMDEFEAHAKRADEGDYALDWVFIGKSNVSYGSIYGDSPESLAAELVDAYSNYLSSLYAVVGIEAADREVISISVANVGTINSYAKANKYLNNLSVVESATLTQQQGTVATFSVTLLGTVDDFLNALRLESAMKQVTDAYGQKVEALNFYWSQ